MTDITKGARGVYGDTRATNDVHAVLTGASQLAAAEAAALVITVDGHFPGSATVPGFPGRGLFQSQAGCDAALLSDPDEKEGPSWL